MVGHPSGEGKAGAPLLPDPQGLSLREREEICAQALARAEELRRAGRYQEGISLLVEALRYRVSQAQIYFRLGNLYFDSGDLARAEYAYRRAIEEDPQHPAAHHNLGVVYRRQGKIAQSVKLLKKARKLDLRRPPQVQLTPQQRRKLWKLVLPLLLVPLTVLVGLLLLLLLISRLR
jgi:tetratricopeptide (TPR) repeat protein